MEQLLEGVIGVIFWGEEGVIEFGEGVGGGLGFGQFFVD